MKEMPENKEIESLILKLLESVGENPRRAGLAGTPARVARAWREWTAGHTPFPHELTLFPTNFDGIIARKGIPFASTCEHHLAHYSGTIDFGYIPNKKVLGISKIIRLMQHYSAKLTLQEDLTIDLAKKFAEAVHPKGVVIKISGLHSCESSRGVTVADVPTITFLATGIFKKDPALVGQFYHLVQ